MMTRKVNPVPKGFHTVTPYLIVRGAADAIEFYQKTFDAEERSRALSPDGASIVHAELKIGNSIVLLADEVLAMGIPSPLALNGTSVTLHLYVKNVDTLWQRAIDAGAQVVVPLQDMYWGDRYGKLVDPFGHHWSVATHVRDLTPEEIHQAMRRMGG